MSISTPFINRPVGTSLLMAAIFLVGIAAYPLLPVAPLPEVEFPTITVSANYPGASPDIMASSVAEAAGNPVQPDPGPGADDLGERARHLTITLQFDLDRNVDAAATDVLEAINAATGQLPKNLPSQPTLRKVNPADAPIFIIAVQCDDAPLTTVDDYAENILSQQTVANRRRQPGARRRPAEAGHPHRCRSGQTRRHGPDAGGRAQRAHASHGEQPERQHRRPAPVAHPATPTTSSPRPRPYDNLIVA